MRRVLMGVLLAASLGISSLVGPAHAATRIAEPPTSSELVTATNALLRPADVAGVLAKAATSKDAYRVGFTAPPGGQDPLPVCVYASGYRRVSIPLSGAVGFSARLGSVFQDVYRYPSTAAAQRAWASLSANVESRCTGTFAEGTNRSTLSSHPVAGVAGNPKGWGVTTRSTFGERYSVVQLVGDAISMVSVSPDGSALASGTARAANALATSLATRWLDRAALPLTQDPMLTKAQKAMLDAADVPADLPVTKAADGGWSDFTSYTPDVDMFGCFGVLESLQAASSFSASLGGLGDVFPGAGSLTQQVFAYASADAATADWRRLQRAITKCEGRNDGGPNTQLDRRDHGVSAMSFAGVPGLWTRGADSYQGSFSVKSYTIYLLLGDAIQSVTYATGTQQVRPVRLDQLPINELAEQLANRWVHGAAVEDGAVTRQVLDNFAKLTRIPRCSKQEGAVSAWLSNWAREQGFASVTDSARNVIVTVPASTGRASEPAVALQAHMDMVCAKTTDSTHDFATDPITMVREGDWLGADRTTLGADDGIGVAIAMTLATDPSVSHPPLELVFTTDEEAGMSGAEALSTSTLTASRFVNIDWETEGSMAIGSAGGNKLDITLPVASSALPAGWDTYRLEVSGLAGGHSGVEIHKNRANANVLLASLLKAADPVRIAAFRGGTADNAIAPSAEATFAVARSDSGALAKTVATAERRVRAQYPDETGLTITLAKARAVPATFATTADSTKLIDLIQAIPQGVVEASALFPGLPETSNNIGIVKPTTGGYQILAFHRSFDPTKLTALAQQIEATAKAAGATVDTSSSFPTWPPNPNTALHAAALQAYRVALGAELEPVVVHAGLENGFIAEKYPNMQMISIGPTLLDVHTPNERLYVPSIDRVMTLARQLLAIV